MGISHLSIFVLIILETNAITLKNGGYEDVYVLIRDRIKESDELIQRIKVSRVFEQKLIVCED